MTALIPTLVLITISCGSPVCDYPCLPSHQFSCNPYMHVRDVPPLLPQRQLVAGGPLPITRAVVRVAVGVPINVVRNSAIRLHNLRVKTNQTRKEYNVRIY